MKTARVVLLTICLAIAACTGAAVQSTNCLPMMAASCAAQFDPMTNRPQFGACMANAATTCGATPTTSTGK